MQPRSFEERLTMLEKQMLEMRELPARVTRLESQIVQLRQEMRDEFSAIRTEFRLGIASAVASFREALSETNAQMRTLHEDAIQRIATIGEGRRIKRKK